MQNKRTRLTGLTIIAMALAGLSTAAVGQQGPGREPGPGRGPMGPHGGFERIFMQIDTDGDGKITLQDVEAWKAAQPKVEDSNADGKISAEELAAPMIAEATRRAQERAARIVAELDTDGDGLLSAAELAQRPLAGPMSGPSGFGEGPDGGGFSKAPDLGRLFQRLDADGDGVVTRDEVEKAAVRMKGHGPKGEGRKPPSEQPEGRPDGQPDGADEN